MKKLICIAAFALMTSATLLAQSEKEGKVQQGGEESRGIHAQRTENELKDDRGQVPKDSRVDVAVKEGGDNVSDTSTNNGTAMATSREIINRNEDQPRNEESKNVNAPTVIQRTSSESGSPAIIASDGKGRDGTNTVQEAKPNMAGAEMPMDMKLSERNSRTRNINSGREVREAEETPSATPSQADQRKANALEGKKIDKGQVKDEVAPEQKETVLEKDEDRTDKKSKRKSDKKRKNKDEDS